MTVGSAVEADISTLEREARERHFVEEVGLFFAQSGAQRMMGRVLGRLLICDPPEQTAAQLAAYLHASAGSISTVTRMLVEQDMVQRVAVPGERATYFRLRDRGWAEMMRKRTVLLRLFRELAGRGLDMLADDPPERRQRLQAFHDFYLFMEERLSSLLDTWDDDQGRQR